jgi:hypothetical protein
MKTQINRRGFVKSSLLASAAIPLGLRSQTPSVPETASSPGSSASQTEGTMPRGQIGGQAFSRLMLGGNLIGGYAHSRDLSYVATLMRRYNTESKIRETLELAETQGINAINTWVMQENASLFAHWKNGGKMKWIAQVRIDAGGGCSQIQQAIDQGAAGVHVTGDTAEALLAQGKFEKVGETVEMIKSQNCIAGVAAHDLRVIVECEKLKLDADFYQKTLHTHDYYTAPRAGESGPVGSNDNSWCDDPPAVVDVMAKVRRPWIAFKVLAAGAIPPRAAFPYAFKSGADFILVGMFDWQVAENAQLARRIVGLVSKPESQRTRPWFG